MISSIVKLNRTIHEGYDAVSWVMPTLAGTSIISILITGIKPLASLPGVAIPLTTIGAYYFIGKRHEERK
jgi:hypothetical protein